jgi:hypothetical protein
MCEQSGGDALARPWVVELLQNGQSLGFLHAVGAETGHEFVVVFGDLASARAYIRQQGTKGAVPATFPTPEGFADFLRQMQQQGTIYFGLQDPGTGKATVWPIQTYLDTPPEERN